MRTDVVLVVLQQNLIAVVNISLPLAADALFNPTVERVVLVIDLLLANARVIGVIDIRVLQPPAMIPVVTNFASILRTRGDDLFNSLAAIAFIVVFVGVLIVAGQAVVNGGGIAGIGAVAQRVVGRGVVRGKVRIEMLFA